MIVHPFGRLLSALLVVLVFSLTTSFAFAQSDRGVYEGQLRVVKFAESLPLRDIPIIEIRQLPDGWGGATIDPSGVEGKPVYGRQSNDEAMQSDGPPQNIPAPIISFDTLPNQLGFSPPDPVGDIGPLHYVTMSNVHFAVHDRTGGLVFGPAANNTLWTGFGGECETQNAGDPIVLYDQFADRWLLTQFTSNAEAGTGEFYNCVAVSQTGDPTGSWYLWQIANNGLFPDYPKYGIGEEAYYISTRDFSAGYDGVGAFAMNRAELIAGNANPTVISFFVDRSNPENVGDGLLPMDVDGDTWPADSTKHYYFGTMDDGGPYGAAQDAITVWEFDVDFATPANSSFTLTDTIPITPYDTIFPCAGRNCIPQPNTAVGLDHQGYRQRPLHRAAYRNFGTHESIVFNQSVEADPGISGIRWWEVRSPGSTPFVFQEGTYAPGNTDGIHRWFGSAAMDSSGNMALGYSAANESVFPSIWYSGRLASDALGTLPQGEGVIVDGLGSQTSTGSRWGDYTSMNIDPLDDCTFWYLNEWYPATSTTGWTLRVGAFKFDECGEPGFTLVVPGGTQASICQGDDAMYGFDLGSILEFDEPVTLSSTGEPAGTTAMFDPNPVPALPGSSDLTISNTGAAAPGDYTIEVTGTATGADDRTANVELSVFDVVPGEPVLMSPADAAIDVALSPTFEWSGMNAEEYTIELATDMAFGNVIWTETTSDTSITLPFFLGSGETYYWSVTPANACGMGSAAAIWSFTTVSLPGDCDVGEVLTIAQSFDFEDGAQGWTSGSNLGPDTWTLSGDNPNTGDQHWHVDDVDEPSDTFLTSPALSIPTGLSNLTFRFFNAQQFEAPPGPAECWDGGILEVSTDGGGNFTQILTGDLLTDPYDGILRTGGSNPLEALNAWCDQSQPYTDSRVDISGLAGEANVVFRLRVGTDVSAGAPGWDIDDVAIAGCSAFLEFDDGFEDEDM
ncbi:MAG TPA: hypothetical protein VJ984_08285 [Xanthomonadales bacterium]|nr:hypothetical protein [Xanthomonadales bacterium]